MSTFKVNGGTIEFRTQLYHRGDNIVTDEITPVLKRALICGQITAIEIDLKGEQVKEEPVIEKKEEPAPSPQKEPSDQELGKQPKKSTR